jgi:hypothetical protein
MDFVTKTTILKYFLFKILNWICFFFFPTTKNCHTKKIFLINFFSIKIYLYCFGIDFFVHVFVFLFAIVAQ